MDVELHDCPICFEKVTKTDELVLPCTHSFHAHCIHKLRCADIAQVCPMCRAPLPGPSPKQYFEEATDIYIQLEERVQHHLTSWGSLAPWEQSVMDQALANWRIAASSGIKEAMYNLAIMHRLGRGVQQNDVTAVFWYKQAAVLGHANAQNNLGYMLNHERGAPKDEIKAAHWYRLAAEQGLADAQYNLAVMYRYGRGVKKSEHKAMNWFRFAAAGGSAQAEDVLQKAEEEYNAQVHYQGYGYVPLEMQAF